MLCGKVATRMHVQCSPETGGNAVIRAAMEMMIASFSRNGRRGFFDCADFPWVARVEAGWPAIRAELDALLVERSRIPNFQDISEDQRVLTQGEEWKTFFFHAYGYRAEGNCTRCPQTAAAR